MKQAPSQPRLDELFLLAVDQHGCERALPAIEGWRGIEVMRDRGIDLGATCAGRHVCVDRPWRERVHPSTAAQGDRRYEAFGIEPASRLCRQMLMAPGLGGLAVRLAAGAELE